MSVSTMAWAWKQKCTPTEKLILLALADHANDDGRCWPGMERVAQKTGLSRRAVVKSVKSLQAKGILGVTNRAVGGLKKSNIYTLIVDNENASPRCERGSHRCEPDDQIDVNEVHIEPIKEPSIKNNIPFLEIVDYLNEKTGKSFRATTVKTKNLIKARWKEGFSLEDFKSVIDTMSELWSGQGEMELYLRPVTLFGEKFEGYLQKKLKNQKVVQLTPKQQQENDEWNRLFSQT